MHKHSANNISTSRIKSKYLDKVDKEKQTVPLLIKQRKSTVCKSSGKIKLTDLCPEQKLKVGELIRTLEQRKQQNERISSQYITISSKCDSLEKMLGQVREQLRRTEEQYQELNDKVRDKQRKIIQQEQYISHIEEQMSQLKQVVESIYERQLVDFSTQTELSKVVSAEVSIQTKKRKYKNRQTQVNISPRQSLQGRDLFYRPHSKSFEKIMKGPLPHILQSHANRSLHDYLTTEKYSQKRYDSSNRQSKYSPDVNNFQEQAEQCVESLARRWREIKQKGERVSAGMSKGNSKQISRFNDCVEQDSDEDLEDGYSKKKAQKSQRLEEYDQKYLNRLLKSKNFSANKLLKGQPTSFDNQSSKKSQQVSYLKSPYFKDRQKQQSSTQKAPSSQHQLSTDQNINFFESDILQIAERLKHN